MTEATCATPVRTLASLTRKERNWLRTKRCGFCETSCLSERCYSYSGEMELPAIEGVRDATVTVNLGDPCNMDERRAVWLQSYRPRGEHQPQPNRSET